MTIDASRDASGQMMSGTDLYRLVEEYADLGDHRTGTDVDAATTDWFASELSDRGGHVELLEYRFDRYDATWDVRVDGCSIDALPLFYEGAGHVRTDAPVTGAAPAMSVLTGVPSHTELVERARATGALAVALSTVGAEGDRLIVPNRAPQQPHDIPVILVEGTNLDGAIDVSVDARIVDGTSRNVVARFGEGDRPLMITTPLSGWFACAGERGTGIAVLLEAAARLSDERPLVVVGTTGHELQDLGAKLLVEEGRVAGPGAVLHIGASLAARDPTRVARAAIGADHARGLTDALAPLGTAPSFVEVGSRSGWVGEAHEWSQLDVPMVSLVAYFPLMHARDDRPSAATSPGLLQAALDVVLDVARVL